MNDLLPVIKGRPTHKPSDKMRAEVKALTSYGIPLQEVARYVGIAPKTLQKHYRQELDTGRIAAHKAVGQFLFNAASGEALKRGATYADCLRAAMFWAKTKLGFSEAPPEGEVNDEVDRDIRITVLKAKGPVTVTRGAWWMTRARRNTPAHAWNTLITVITPSE